MTNLTDGPQSVCITELKLVLIISEVSKEEAVA